MGSTGAFCLLSQRSSLIELRLKAVVAEYTTCYNKSTDKVRCHVIKGGRSVNQINAVAIGKLISAHRECDEQKFKAYVDFIAKAYEEQGNDRAANIIRSNYTGDYGEQGKVVLDEATEQTTYYETPTIMSIKLRRVPKTARYMVFSSTVQCICVNRKSNRLLSSSKMKSSVTAY